MRWRLLLLEVRLSQAAPQAGARGCRPRAGIAPPPCLRGHQQLPARRYPWMGAERSSAPPGACPRHARTRAHPCRRQQQRRAMVGAASPRRPAVTAQPQPLQRRQHLTRAPHDNGCLRLGVTAQCPAQPRSQPLHRQLLQARRLPRLGARAGCPLRGEARSSRRQAPPSRTAPHQQNQQQQQQRMAPRRRPVSGRCLRPDGLERARTAQQPPRCRHPSRPPPRHRWQRPRVTRRQQHR